MSQFCFAHSQLFRNLAYLRKPTQFISLIYGESKRRFRIICIPESSFFISMVYFSTFGKKVYLLLFLNITAPVVLTVFCSSCHQLMFWLVKFCTVRLNLCSCFCLFFALLQFPSGDRNQQFSLV